MKLKDICPSCGSEIFVTVSKAAACSVCGCRTLPCSICPLISECMTSNVEKYLRCQLFGVRTDYFTAG